MMRVIFAALILFNAVSANVFDNYSLLSQLDLLPKAAP
jgi:hypothetical protein